MKPSDATQRGSRDRVVLMFNRVFLPGFRAGGPVRSLAALTEQLGDHFTFKVVTTDRDSFAADAYPGVSPDTWTSAHGCEVLYTSRRGRTFARIVKVLRNEKFQAVYLNSVFDPRFSLPVLVARRLGVVPRAPLIIAPRGEFSPGALALNGRLKKLYLRLFSVFGLGKDVIWHATSDNEVSDIQRVLRAVGTKSYQVRLAPNLVVPQCEPTCIQPESAVGSKEVRENRALRVCFLSRITRKKNLDYALKVLTHVRSRVEFLIVGPVQDARYWAECEAIIEGLPENISVEWMDAMPHEAAMRILREQDLFFFPTRGENFGHVIFEALAAGLPVLTSDQTPWNDLESRGVGWTVPLQQERRFVEIIEHESRLVTNARVDRRRIVQRYAISISDSSRVVDASRRLFEEAIRAGEAPRDRA